MQKISWFVKKLFQRSKTSKKQSDTIPSPNEQDIWNVVTQYGRYEDVWETYRCYGMLEAIKVRDEKAEFDRKLSVSGKVNQPNYEFQSKSIHQLNNLAVSKDTKQLLDEFDIAIIKSLASYFEEMPNKIRQYHEDHHASRKEADAIANYYMDLSKVFKDINTQKKLSQLIEHLEALKEKVGRFNHNEYKYRWSTSLENNVLVKLRKMVNT